MNKLIIFLALVAMATADFVEENHGTEDSEGLIEGDMRLTTEQRFGLMFRGATPSRKWDKSVVPYELSPEIEDSDKAMKAIKEAFKEFTDNTCVRFRKKTDSDTAYVSVFKGSGCWSYVGKTGRMQQLSLAPGCWYKGVVIHEFNHALGFYHEQSRPDRDNYVTIKWDNIQDGKESNFKKHPNAVSYGTKYDYSSIMHYGRTAFAKDYSKPTIVAKNGENFGQRRGLSATDITEVRRRYSCGGPKPSPTSPTKGFRCNFNKDLCGFENMKDDEFDWRRKRGGTPSRGTGPNGDHPNGKGHYMYIETSRPRWPDDMAVLQKNGLLFDEKTCVRFYYHMLGQDVNRLIVRIGSKEIFSVSGPQGNHWKKAEIRVTETGDFPLKFEGIRGNSWQGDIAIDDVEVGPCDEKTKPTTGPPPPKPVTTKPPRRPPPPRPGNCGKRLGGSRIVGGTNAAYGDLTWQVQIRRKQDGFVFCGGTLVHPRWVVTAAHCVDFFHGDASKLDIRAGAFYLHGSKGNEQVGKVVKIIEHQLYKNPPYQMDNDIALLKLESPLKLGRYVSLACLPHGEPVPRVGTKCVISGWGTLSSGGARPNILQVANVPVVSDDDCRKAYPKEFHYKTMICAGRKEGGIDSCQGDSGGPMVCESKGRYYLQGVTSWGYGCAAPGKYGVYARVHDLMKWVRDEMAKN